MKLARSMQQSCTTTYQLGALDAFVITPSCTFFPDQACIVLLLRASNQRQAAETLVGSIIGDTVDQLATGTIGVQRA